MRWFDNLKIRHKLLIVFGLFLCLMTCLAVFAVIRTVAILNETSAWVHSYQVRQAHVTDATLAVSRMRVANLARLTLLADNQHIQDVVPELLKNYEKDAALVKENIQSFHNLMLADPRLNDAEREDRGAILKAVLYSFARYMEIAANFAAAIESRDQTAILRLYEQGILQGQELFDRLELLSNTIASTARQKTLGNNTHRAIAIISVMTVGCLLLSLATLFFAIPEINRPIATLERAVTEIAQGNLTYPIRSERKDEVGSLANRIGDMVDAISEHGKMTAVMDKLDSMIYVTDLNYTVLYTNKFLTDAFALDRETCVGQKCYKAFKDLDQPCSICRFPDLSTQTALWPSIDYEVWDDNLYMWLGGTDAIIRWVDGSKVFFSSTRNITYKKEQEVLLQEAVTAARTASVAKSSFLANMSHEIRTPMNAILGVTEILLVRETLTPEDREGLNQIYNSADLLLSIINDILDLSKIEAGKLELMLEKYEIASVIHDTIQLNVMRIKSKPIELRLEMEDNLPAHLYGDSLRIKQILNNLLSNACKYTDKGEITMSVAAETGHNSTEVTLVFRVRDTGFGMTEEQLSKLFDEYTRFHEGTRTTIGTGLGMSITRNLVQMMHGKIAVESRLGEGTSVTVHVPQTRLDDAVISKEGAENLRMFRIDQKKQREKTHVAREPMPYGSVLVVDDVETNLYVAEGLLRLYKLRIDTATSGFEAVEKIKNGHEYDIVFMDHLMPQMDGVATTKILRDLGYTRPIVALTANATVGQEDMFLASGFDGFISKPIDLRRLNAVLNRLIRDKQTPETLDAVRRQFASPTDDDALDPVEDDAESDAG